jgi:Copper type II ascorbate-dependent monooxygenase, C-terminal domain
MRNRLVSAALLALAIAACGEVNGTNTTDIDAAVSADAPATTANSFRVTTPDITIKAGEEVTYCYYTTIPTTEMRGVKRWSSTMTPGSHHLILFFGDSGKADGTVDKTCAGLGGQPYWTYSAQSAVNEAVMPAGIGMTVPAGQKVYVQMHYLNTSDADLQAHAVIEAETYTAAETFIPAAAFVTYNTQISLPPNSTGSAGGTCAVPADAKFFQMSTHTHWRATRTEVKDAESMLFTASDWEHPGIKTWTEPFFTFASGKLTYKCDYNNPESVTVREGQSAEADEMCMAVGYFFPATEPKICINSYALP